MNELEDVSHGRPSVAATLLLLVGAAGFMAIFFGIYELLGVRMPFFGLLFLVYWAAILKQDLKTFFPTVFGALAGMALGWLLITAPSSFGNAGTAVSALLLILVLFCFMRGHLNLFINNATMLFLTAVTVPQFDISTHILPMISSLLIGACYMGGTALAVHHFLKWRARPNG